MIAVCKFRTWKPWFCFQLEIIFLWHNDLVNYSSVEETLSIIHNARVIDLLLVFAFFIFTLSCLKFTWLEQKNLKFGVERKAHSDHH